MTKSGQKTIPILYAEKKIVVAVQHAMLFVLEKLFAW